MIDIQDDALIEANDRFMLLSIDRPEHLRHGVEFGTDLPFVAHNRKMTGAFPV
jgi:hypothetical protein